MNVAELLRQRAEERPGAAAIIQSSLGCDRVMTFSELEIASQKAAAMLLSLGLKPGDAVLVFQPMSIELYVALSAIFRARLVAMFLDPSAGREHIARCCEVNPPAAFLGSSKAHILLLTSRALRQIPRRISIGMHIPGSIPWSRHDHMQPLDSIEQTAADAPALLTFTSGSTGFPKAAIRTHGFLIAQHRALEQSIQLEPGETDLATLPIFLLANLASGLSSVIPDADLRRPGFIDPQPIISQITRLKPTRVAASPAFLEKLIECCKRENRRLFNFRKIYVGGAPVFPNLLRRLKQCAPNADIVAVYGSTEAESIAHVAFDEIRAEDFTAITSGRGLLGGKTAPMITLRILNDQWGRSLGQLSREEFDAASLPRGEIGEIVVSGEHVLKTYLNHCGDEETKFEADGTIWHRTGDAGWLDAQDRLWLMGRCAARVQDEHGIIYPLAVECVAQQFDFIRRCAFARHGSRRILAVEFTDAAEPQARIAKLAVALRWANIDFIKPVRRIPVDKRHNAKVDYNRLSKYLQ